MYYRHEGIAQAPLNKLCFHTAEAVRKQRDNTPTEKDGGAQFKENYKLYSAQQTYVNRNQVQKNRAQLTKVWIMVSSHRSASVTVQNVGAGFTLHNFQS